MKHAVILPCIATLILILVIAICATWRNAELYPAYDHSAEEALRNQANEENTYVISYQQSSRIGKYTQVDATDNNLYFSYSKSSCIDVFNHHGEFQYAILLPDCQNGTVQIRCVSNYLLVLDKNNTVYIFDGNKEIEKMNYDQAKRCGYDFFWFEEKKSNQKIDKSYYYERDSTGNIVRTVLLPIKNTSINFMRIAVIVIAMLLYLVSILRYFLKSISFRS